MGGKVIKFIYGKPASKAGSLLAVADLHLGIERELESKGVRIGSLFGKMKSELLSLLQKEKPKQFVIVGDVKHSIPGVEYADQAELKSLFSELAALAEVTVVPGNHDGSLARVLAGIPRVQFIQSSGVKLGELGFAHGHAWPSPEVMEADYLFVGHAHPCVEFVDANGFRSVERAWLVAECNQSKLVEKYPNANEEMKLVLIPAFNPLAGGIPLNRGGERSWIGPLLKSGMFKLRDAQTFLLDGVRLGSISSLPRSDYR